MKQVHPTQQFSRMISIQQQIRLDAELDATGPSMNTLTKLRCGTLNPTNQEELQMGTTILTFQRTTSIQLTLCGLVSTKQTAVVMNGQDTADIGTML